MLQQTNIQGLVKDPTTGAVINTDKNAFEIYKAQRNTSKKQQEALKSVEEIQQEVTSLKEDMNDIKSMLAILIQREK